MGKIFYHPDFAQIFANTFPFGLLIVDEKGTVQAANGILESILNVNINELFGKPLGEVLGCIKSLETPSKYHSYNNCSDCVICSLVSSSSKTYRVKKTITSLQIFNHGQVKNLDFLISTVPFAILDRRYSYLIIEKIPTKSSLNPAIRQKNIKEIIGQHHKMKELFRTIRQVAVTSITVLIQGETGTGKELVARAIHNLSPRSSMHFVPVNCGALPDGLLATELFGHLKGAFTGAISDKKGRFQLAHKGTLFLDEVGDLSRAMQAQLLRVLQDGIVQPVGSEKTYETDVRIISATNKNIAKRVETGHFRKDLFYRLNTIPIDLPPLRERRSDIPLLSKHFLEHYGKEFFGKMPKFSSETRSMLMAYDWPGNVRELQNAIQFALAKCTGKTIEPSHLLKAIRSKAYKPFSVAHRRPMLRVEEVIHALKKTEDNKTKAAKLLGVSRSTLYRFIENHQRVLS